jgi:hypothetical protein
MRQVLVVKAEKPMLVDLYFNDVYSLEESFKELRMSF